MAIYSRDSKRDGRKWVVDFTVGGQRVNQTLHGARTKTEAKAAEAKLRAEYQARLSHAGSVSRMTVETAIQRYVAERLKPKSSPASLEIYLVILSLIREHFGPTTPIETLTRAKVADWWGVTVARVKSTTAKRYLTQLKALLAFAREAGAGNDVPTFSPKVPDDSRVRWLHDDEEARLASASPQWLTDLVVFSVETGARKGDTLGLTWRHVNLAPNARGSVRFYQTKEDRPRGVPLSRRARAMLERLRGERPDAKLDDLVFSRSEAGGRTGPVGDFKRLWASVKAKAEVTDLHFHDLRHTFASRLVMRRVPLHEVSKLMGHNSLRMTMRYAHLAPDALDTAIGALDA